ncbi:MAG: hypothetical protein RL701_7796 [Pseudomonadota bacterium]|jgi:hypothetical protein
MFSLHKLNSTLRRLETGEIDVTAPAARIGEFVYSAYMARTRLLRAPLIEPRPLDPDAPEPERHWPATKAWVAAQFTSTITRLNATAARNGAAARGKAAITSLLRPADPEQKR